MATRPAPGSSFAWPGDVVEPDAGILRCSRSPAGRLCAALLGVAPPPGTVVADVLPPARVERNERDLWAVRCPDCGAVYVLATESAGEVA